MDKQHSAGASAMPASAAEALALNGASRAKADAYLNEQIAFVRKQMESLDEQHDIELERLHEQRRQLRFQSWDQGLTLALKIVGGLVVLAIVIGLGAMVWSASEQTGLAIEAFSVPPDMASRGLTGQVVSTRVLDKLERMEGETETPWAAAHSAREAQDIKIEIPDTGISIGELMRYLRGWLGSEVHVTGEVFRNPAGTISVTARYGDTPGETLTGNNADFDALLEKSAEQLYRASQPIRFADYLTNKKRYDEALAILLPLTRTGNVQSEAFALASVSALYADRGQWDTALRYGHDGVVLIPGDPVAHYWLGTEEDSSGHIEKALPEFRAAIAGLESGHVEGVDDKYVREALLSSTGTVDEYLGDLADSLRHLDAAENSGFKNDFESLDRTSDHDVAGGEYYAARIRPTMDDGKPAEAPAFADFYLAIEKQDWRSALAWALEADIRHVRINRFDILERWVRHFPMIAIGRMHTGDLAGAHRIIDYTPLDCYECVITRGLVREEERNYAAASYWFQRAWKDNPSIPEAPWRWGQMLLRNGDTKSAILAFAAANARGPHFADPLEGWGEALMLQNRSDLALAKFEEAARYAPKWGRLHLKWGEALHYASKPDEARRQFELAASLFLTPADSASLAKFAHGQ
jgi:tetratricopeptide (TPR) repeat protein